MSELLTAGRLALRVPEEAAAALGMSDESFNRHVRPHVRLVRLGRLVLVSVAELQRYLDEAAALTIEAQR